VIGLAGETLVWTAMFAVVLLCDALVERWVGRAARQATKENRRIRRLLEVLRGLLSFAITAILSFLLVSVLAASSAKGQVLFAAAAGFFVAALAASWVTGERRPVWQVLAVPVTALAAYLYAAARPDRPRGMEEFLQLAPHAVVRLLPVEYFAAGIAGAVFGTWTAVRIAHESEADGADGAKAGG